VIPAGSTEQHGPNGLIGTDTLCPEALALRGIVAGYTKFADATDQADQSCTRR
jgi:creatinine amidohydrolase/Fe(II)-dependent formamide hydrolase-like protein